MRIGNVDEVRAIRAKEELEIERMTMLEDIDEFEHRNGIRMHPDNPILNPNIPRFADRKRQDIQELKNIGVRPCTPPRGDSVLDYYDMAPAVFTKLSDGPMSHRSGSRTHRALTTQERAKKFGQVPTRQTTATASSMCGISRPPTHGRSVGITEQTTEFAGYENHFPSRGSTRDTTRSKNTGANPNVVALPPLDLSAVNSYKDVHIVTKRSLLAETARSRRSNSTRSVKSGTSGHSSSRNLAGSYYLDPVFIQHRPKTDNSTPPSTEPFRTAVPRIRKDQEIDHYVPNKDNEPEIERRLKAEVAKVIRSRDERNRRLDELEAAARAQLRQDRRLALTARRQEREAMQARLGQVAPRAKPRPETPPFVYVDKFAEEEMERDIAAQREQMDITHKKAKAAELEAHFARVREQEAKARRRAAGSSRRTYAGGRGSSHASSIPAA